MATHRRTSPLVTGTTLAALLAASLPAHALAAPPPPPPPAPGPDPGPAPPSKYVWGPYRAPAWKKAALGTSAVLTVAALGLGLGAGLRLRPLKDDLRQAAADSLTDDKPSNDVDPSTGDDLCILARSVPSGGALGTVTNAEMTQICNKGDRLAGLSRGGLITGGVLLGATLVFTVLMFVHKRSPAVARLQHRGLRLGAAPTPGGWMAGAGWRF